MQKHKHRYICIYAYTQRDTYSIYRLYIHVCMWVCELWGNSLTKHFYQSQRDFEFGLLCCFVLLPAIATTTTTNRLASKWTKKRVQGHWEF